MKRAVGLNARRRAGIRAGLLAGAAVGALAAAPAAAQSINTFPAWNGTQFISSWGETNTATYGQTITPTASQRVLQNFTFSLSQSAGTPPNYQAFVYQWDPVTQRITGNALFTSPVLTAPATGVGQFQNVTVNTGGVNLTPGQQYVLFFTTSSVNPPNPAAAAYRYGATPNTAYAGGQFVFQNNGDNFNQLSTAPWSFITQDLAFSAFLLGLIVPSLPNAAPINQFNVATAIDKFTLGNGTTPLALASLGALPPDQLLFALSEVSGEVSTGAQKASTLLMNGFLSLMLDPFTENRVGFADQGSTPLGYAQERQPAGASAFAKVLKAPAFVPPPEQRWSVWGASYGAQNQNDGDPAVVGSHSARTSALGYSVGVDYRFAPGAVVGVAVAGGHTQWDLGLGLGHGDGDAIQAGVYGKYQWNAAYIAGAIAAAFHDMSTTRTVTVAGADTLRADFDARTFGGRLEGGYRLAWGTYGVTPYAAGQVQTFNTPNYSEVAASGLPTFALNFAENNATAVRAELGARFDTRFLSSPDMVGTLFGRLAYAHDWADDHAMVGLFQALPGAGFTVFGADPNTDLVLASVGAEFATRSGWSISGKIGGEFGSDIQTYNALGKVRYSW